MVTSGRGTSYHNRQNHEIEMVTTNNPNLGTNYSLSVLLGYHTKAEMQKTADKIDLYLAHSYRKEEQAKALASEIVSEPINTLRLLSEKELAIVRKIVDAGAGAGVHVKKMPKSLYKLHKLNLVINYDNGTDWIMFMPDELRNAFAEEMKAPGFALRQGMSAKDERRLGMLAFLYGNLGKD